MPYAKKKPVVLEYMQFTTEQSIREIQMWANGVYASSSAEGIARDTFIQSVAVNVPDPDGDDATVIMVLRVKTLEGWVVAQRGDYILKGKEEKEFWPVRQDIFEKTYDKVNANIRLDPGAISIAPRTGTASTFNNASGETAHE